ncbi:OPT family small oligopeptide transporter [Ramicandelaber brevisporus]|nr:OPT family small oligopeptide transporter [Ramicandelaber brevisporus]
MLLNQDANNNCSSRNGYEHDHRRTASVTPVLPAISPASTALSTSSAATAVASSSNDCTSVAIPCHKLTSNCIDYDYCNDNDDDVCVDENSPYFEVRAAVSNRDDPSMPSLTFRVWLLGILWTCVLAFVNQFFWFRANPISLGTLVVQIAVFPLGRLLEFILPRRQFQTFGWRWSLNPAPFSIKEHALICIFASAGAGTVYAIDIVVIKDVFYHSSLGEGPSLLLMLTTQMIGYGLAGICRAFLVYPAAMIWPSNLANIVLFRTFHEASSFGWVGMSRTRFFWCIFAVSFIWYWVPGYLFTMLSLFSILCMFDRDSVLFAQLSSGQFGLGLLNIPMDWTNIAGNLGSPITTPFWAVANVFAGFVIIMWIVTPALYYANVWDAQKYPIYDWHVYDAYGNRYNTTRVLMTDAANNIQHLNETAYREYSTLFMPAQFAVSYGVGFAGLSCVLTYIFLYHRHDLWMRYRDARNQPNDDIHMRLMRAYPEVPVWWYAAMFTVFAGLAIIACEKYSLQVHWYMFLFCLLLPLIFTIPIGMIQAVTNQQPGLNIISELIFGYLYPGNPIGNVTYKTYTYICQTQALFLISDLKLGHYLKIPPRHLFVCQSVGTLLAAAIQLFVAYWLLDTVKDMCDPRPTNPWSCSSAATFYSASIVWGLVGSKKTFNDQDYGVTLHGFWIGALLPIPIYLLQRQFPKSSLLKHVHIPVILSASGSLPSAPPADFVAWTVVGYIFNHYLKRRRRDWYEKYAFAFSAGMDSGLAIATVVIFFLLTNRGVELRWEGNRMSCLAELQPAIPPAVTQNSGSSHIELNQ